MSVPITASQRGEWIVTSDTLASNLANRCWKSLSQRAGHGLERDDVLQEARIGLVRAANDFDPKFGTAFSTWAAYKIRSSLCAMLRRIGHLPESEQFDIESGSGEDYAAPPVDHDTALDVRGAVAQLPANQRLLIEAIHFEGRSCGELAALNDCSTKTIRRRLSEAEAALKILFTPDNSSHEILPFHLD